MDKTKLVDLKRKIFLRSALIPVEGLDEIFSLNDMFSGDEILAELFKKSLRNFEYHNPLIWESRVIKDQLCSCAGRDGYCEIRSNFESLYLKCLIDEGQIILVPNAMPKIRLAGSYPYPGTYMLPIDYDRPFINLGSVMDNQFYIRGICSRPIIVDYTPDKQFADTGAIYWMNIEEGVLGQKFLDQCMVDVLEYVRNLKGNMTLPNINVDIFNAVDIAYQQLKSELDQYYLQSVWRGDLLV